MPPAHAIPLISASLMRWPGGRDGTREIPADITMRRDVSRISLFSREARNRNGRNSREGERRRFAPPPGGITQLRSFPLKLFLRFHVGLGRVPGRLAPLPVILLRNSDNAAAAMNNGRITRRKSANVFFRAAPKPPAGTFESPYRARCLTFHRYQTARDRLMMITLNYHHYIYCVATSNCIFINSQYDPFLLQS